MTEKIPLEARAMMMMGFARQQGRAAKVPTPWVWYGTHILGERMVMIANQEHAEKAPRWPGDLVEPYTEEGEKRALAWLSSPGDQGRHLPPTPEAPREPGPLYAPGIGGVKSERPVLLSIHTYVAAIRSGIEGIEEVQRFDQSSVVECQLLEGKRSSWEPLLKERLSMCTGCGRHVDTRLYHDKGWMLYACPKGWGCGPGRTALED